MQILNWNMEDALAVRYEEGIEKGIEICIEKGIEKNRERIVRNALAKGFPMDTIHDVTGIDIETIKRIALRYR